MEARFNVKDDPMQHFLLIYRLSPDYLERRGQFRDAHLALAWQAHEAGNLVLGGALTDPADQAILLFRGPDSSAAEQFARQDPYVAHGLVAAWEIRQWKTVVGEWAADPVVPTK